MSKKRSAKVIAIKDIAAKRRGSISLCMIARDEEELIGRALASVKDLVDEMIVVDTGSTDGTVLEAKRLGAAVFQAPWRNDFGEARNVALSKATREWVLVLDADEALDARDHERIRRLVGEGERRAFIMRQWTYTHEAPGFGWKSVGADNAMSLGCTGCYEAQQVRLFRNERSIRYEGEIHETLDWSLMAAAVPVIETDIVVHHYGRIEETGRVCRKAVCALDGEAAEARASNARCLYEMAAQLLDLGHVDAALAHGEKAIELEPKAWELWNVAALAHLRRGQRDKALEYFRRALEIGRDIPELCNNLGVVLMEKRDHAEALRCFERGIEIDGRDADLLRNAAAACALAGALEQGLGYVERSIAAEPFAPRSHAVRADILCRMNDLGGACEALERIRFLPHVQLSVRLMAVRLFTRMGMVDEAVVEVHRALEAYPERQELLHIAGRVAELAGEQEQAASYYHRLLAIQPGHVDALTSLGCIAERSDRLEEALAHFRSALGRSPRDARIEVNIGIVLDKLGRTEEAGIHFERATAGGEASGFARNAIGCHLARANRFDEALSHFSEAVRLEPDNASFRRNLALACERLGLDERARENYERSARLDPLMAPFAKERLRALDSNAKEETPEPAVW